ncbi:hypothetical protein [Rhizobium leguminosarum]|uniref:hypothetical protein n=1 Tax=Rhizobium leguminosarum TaxID=384 RepID=UPI001C925E21|nr:hypothetical protein [Rhizobium leguminosarum]MBY2948311.1 hypothetical protein [Rhizobium leguminosarum]
MWPGHRIAKRSRNRFAEDRVDIVKVVPAGNPRLEIPAIAGVIGFAANQLETVTSSIDCIKSGQLDSADGYRPGRPTEAGKAGMEEIGIPFTKGLQELEDRCAMHVELYGPDADACLKIIGIDGFKQTLPTRNHSDIAVGFRNRVAQQWQRDAASLSTSIAVIGLIDRGDRTGVRPKKGQQNAQGRRRQRRQVSS